MNVLNNGVSFVQAFRISLTNDIFFFVLQSDSEPEDTVRGGSVRPTSQSQSRANGPIGKRKKDTLNFYIISPFRIFIAASRQYGNKATTATSSRRKGLQSSFNNGMSLNFIFVPKCD